MKSFTDPNTLAKNHPETMQPLNYDHARSLTSEFWHGIALGTVIGAGAVVAVFSALGKI